MMERKQPQKKKKRYRTIKL